MPTYNDNKEVVCDVCDDPQHTTHSHEQFCQEHPTATSCEGLQQDEVRCKHGVILTYDDCLNCDKEAAARKNTFPPIQNYIVVCHCGFESEVSGEATAQQEVERHEIQCKDKNPIVYACELDD